MATPEDLSEEEFDSLDDLDELNEPALEGELAPDDEDDDLDDEDDDLDDDEAKETSSDDADSDDDDDDVGVVDDDDDDEEEEESLDVILAREQDLEDEFAGVGGSAKRSSPSATPAGEGEFTCRSCFLVKRQAQLADADEMICLDCV